ncbi:NAD(P)-binding protein [Patellaria atrata CBS 101060]|uniref:NAD(P)-binding protein n=1 Tax=Patellaria atrata CBS 101060 TaxID=1346257 RepID=A0A9P4SCD2_9PEZI|nr:NAD(P)-binding protein [Patellaria atrata CBS 101060]
MKAVWAAKGNLENPLSVLRNDIFRQPEVPEGWVRVKVAAVGLNYHDIFTLRGQGMHPIKFPLILGSEGAGTLDDGSEVLIYPVMGSPDFKGDETLDPDRHVLGELTQGSLAEYVVVPRKNAIPKPPELSMIHASVLGIAWLTAYRMLFKLSGLKRGQTMLVQGSSGGVATALIQLGRAAGMTVWSTGRTEEKRAIATSLGAHQTFTPGEILPKLVDAVFDPSGIATWNHSLGSVVLGGTIVTCGGHSGMQVELDLKKVFVEQIKITGCYVGSFEDFQVLIKFIVEHKIEPKISKVLPVDRAEEGLRDLIEGSVQGKIVIKL